MSNPKNRYEVRSLNEDRNWFGVFDTVDASRPARFRSTPQGVVYRGTETACHTWAEAAQAAVWAIEAAEDDTAELEAVAGVPV